MSQDSFDDDFDYSCGLKDNTCTCWDCTVYFNKNTNRPTKSNDITDEEFKELLKLCSDEKVLGLLKEERYKPIIYEVVPFPLWKKLEDEATYNAMVEKLKTDGEVPDEQPEICHVGSVEMIGLNDEETVVKSIYYRFPTSTVKYELIVKKVNDKLLLKTHSRGSEIKI